MSLKSLLNLGPLQRSRRPLIWTVGGGKGGVGKSLISSSLGISLSRLGYRVILVDLDLGAANLHTCLGTLNPQLSLSDFLSGRQPDLSRICTATEFPKLSLISGCHDALDISSLSSEHLAPLMESIKKLSSDIVIIDLGAGTHFTTLDFFLDADRSMVTFTPEPTSLENGYRFIKAAFFRKMKHLEKKFDLGTFISEVMDEKNRYQIRTPYDLIQYIISQKPEIASQIVEELNHIRLEIIMNQTRSLNDIELGNSVLSVCRKYFGLSVHLLGHLDYDNAVWQAVRKRKPVLLEFPHSVISGQFLRICKNLIDHKSKRAVV